MSHIVSGRVLDFWHSQIVAEYGSAAMTAEFSNWLIRLGASPDLVKMCLDVAKDEVDHALICHKIASSLGSTKPIQMQDNALQLTRIHDDFKKDFLDTLVGMYCLGETVAVPLFGAMRKNTREPDVLAVYDRILRDEPRHSEFGWLTLAWLDSAWPDMRAYLQSAFPALLGRIATAYYSETEFAPALSEDELAWGMLPRLNYAQIFEKSVAGIYAVRLSEYGIDVPAVWQSIKPS